MVEDGWQENITAELYNENTDYQEKKDQNSELW